MEYSNKCNSYYYADKNSYTVANKHSEFYSDDKIISCKKSEDYIYYRKNNNLPRILDNQTQTQLQNNSSQKLNSRSLSKSTSTLPNPIEKPFYPENYRANGPYCKASWEYGSHYYE